MDVKVVMEVMVEVVVEVGCKGGLTLFGSDAKGGGCIGVKGSY